MAPMQSPERQEMFGFRLYLPHLRVTDGETELRVSFLHAFVISTGVWNLGPFPENEHLGAIRNSTQA